MSKDGREIAQPHLARFALREPTAHWTPGAAEAPPLLLLPGVHQAHEQPARATQAAAWATAAILCADHPGGLELGMAGPGVAAVYRGSLAKVSHTPPAAHATDLLCKLHARPAAAQAVNDIGEHGLSVRTADGSELRLVPLGAGADHWRARVQARAESLFTSTSIA